MIKIVNYLIGKLLKKSPRLEFALKQASAKESADDYISKSLLISLVFSSIPSAFFLFVFLKEDVSLIYLVAIMLILFLLVFCVMLTLPFIFLRNKSKEIESDLLYSVRYLLLKMRTGATLTKSLRDVSRLHTNSSRHFAEIVSDIYLGEPIEDAIDHAYRTTPSAQFKKVLRVIKDSLNTGVDIRVNMGVLVKEITEEHLVKLESYSKKINSLSLFYMIIGVIVPSLGTSVAVIATGFISIKVTMGLLLFVFGITLLIQYFFILLFKSARPMVGM